jgi:cytochrome c553
VDRVALRRAGSALAAAVIILAAGLLLPARAQTDEAAFKARCGACHGERDIAHWARERPDASARRAWLDRFLQRHYPPPQAERGRIIEHIETVIARPGGRG